MSQKELVKDQVIFNVEKILGEAESELSVRVARLEETKKSAVRNNGTVRDFVAEEIIKKKEVISLLDERIVQLKENLKHAIEDLDRRELERSNAIKFREQASEIAKEYEKLQEDMAHMIDKMGFLVHEAENCERLASATANELKASTPEPIPV